LKKLDNKKAKKIVEKIEPIEFDLLPDSAFLRKKQLLALQLAPYSSSTLWRKCQTNDFPHPIKISKGISAWRVGDIRKHLAQIGVTKDGNA
jgi:predicted DNA-binding transcriptional regulator AlpA